MEGKDDCVVIEVHNFDVDADTSATICNKIINCINSVRPKSATTIFLFASPQFLVKHRKFVAALHNCQLKRTFYPCSYNEGHVFLQQGGSLANQSNGGAVSSTNVDIQK